MTQTDHKNNTRRRETPSGHLRSFGWMLLVTAIAFASVGSRYFPTSITLTVILVMAGIQLILQLTSFMHLDRRSQIPILFMTAGLGFSAIIVVGIYFMRG
ncbi:hypothetical protein GCM10007416_13820 [Kroppenstedtia guangzhouensis]|jgi:cytochrome c oxidase subunit IV|uniref:Cytochrome c oxidase subunit 4 n=1 Tax=Kroppenstedtia guangzhouensis TaxID=1274356 RepID=A0ABQ1GE76_9BACL|nr:cytochrome C oxidase subunit IV family protein [Kroppenstedtia guangzhouensis]GGA42094.1 hypothetical protein GCM10007416_13820 [Kroppenstedtia guangzhouensis]